MKAAPQAACNGIAAGSKDDRNGGGCRFCDRSRLAEGCDNSYLAANQFACKCRQAFKLSLRPAEINRHVLRLGVAGFGQAFAESCDHASRLGRRAAAEE